MKIWLILKFFNGNIKKCLNLQFLNKNDANIILLTYFNKIIKKREKLDSTWNLPIKKHKYDWFLTFYNKNQKRAKFVWIKKGI